ncbi:MAG: ESPR-type extended signal peptide-containing protein, partial [Neisseria sp.]|nr:ESPR-type extended signal peptide-containing protein [Neisseria sp.]
MNKVFKVVFNAATGTWTAVSEVAKAHGKTKSSKVAAVSAAVAAAFAASSASAVTISETYSNFEGNADATVYIAAGRDTSGTVTGTSLGTQSGWTGTSDVAIGWNAQSLKNNGVALGGDSTTNATNSIAIGIGAKAEAIQSIGGNFATTTTASTRNVAIGTRTVVRGNNSVAINANGEIHGNGHIVLGNSGINTPSWRRNMTVNSNFGGGPVPKQDHILVGNSIRESSGLGSIALGHYSAVGAGDLNSDGTAQDPMSMAIGTGAAGYAYSIALGTAARADQQGAGAHWNTGAIAIGSHAESIDR